jgi:hypothetical protein
MGNINNGTGAQVRAQINNNLSAYTDIFESLLYEYRYNVFIIEDFEANNQWASNSWIGATGTKGNDTVNFLTGYQGMSVASGVDGGGCSCTAMTTPQNPYARDYWDKYENYEPSDTNDYICINIYMAAAEITKMAVGGLRFRVFNDTKPTMANYLYIDMPKAGFTNGWNFFAFRKADFTVVGTGRWQLIKGMDIIFNGAPSASAAFTVDCLRMVRKDPLADRPNPFQRKLDNVWTRDFDIQSGNWFVGMEKDKPTWRNLSQVADNNSLMADQSIYGDWEMALTVKCRTQNSLFGMCFFINETLGIRAYLQTGTLWLNSIFGGLEAASANVFVEVGDICEFRLFKKGNSARLNFIKNYDVENMAVLNITTTNLDAPGFPAIMADSASNQEVASFGWTKIKCASRAFMAQQLEGFSKFGFLYYHPGIVWDYKFESINGCATVLGGAITVNTGMCKLTTGASAGQATSLQKNMAYPMNIPSWLKKRGFKTRVMFHTAGSQTIYITIGPSTGNQYAGFKIVNAVMNWCYKVGGSEYTGNLNYDITVDCVRLLELQSIPMGPNLIRLRFLVDGLCIYEVGSLAFVSDANADNLIYLYLTNANAAVKEINLSEWRFIQY